MSKFMIVRFDRYSGEDSDHEIILAKNHNEAYSKYMKDLLGESNETIKQYVKNNPLKGAEQELCCFDCEEESFLVIAITP